MTPIMMAALVAQRVWEVLAFVVALFFPVALLTWLLIDKFVRTDDDGEKFARQHAGRRGRHQVLADHTRPHA